MGALEGDPLVKDDGPGDEGENKEDQEYADADRSRVEDDLKGIESGGRIDGSRGYVLQESSARLFLA